MPIVILLRDEEEEKEAKEQEKKGDECRDEGGQGGMRERDLSRKKQNREDAETYSVFNQYFTMLD